MITKDEITKINELEAWQPLFFRFDGRNHSFLAAAIKNEQKYGEIIDLSIIKHGVMFLKRPVEVRGKKTRTPEFVRAEEIFKTLEAGGSCLISGLNQKSVSTYLKYLCKKNNLSRKYSYRMATSGGFEFRRSTEELEEAWADPAAWYAKHGMSPDGSVLPEATFDLEG